MGLGKVSILMVALAAVACVDKKLVAPCDPQTDDSCSVQPGKTGGCTKNADCGDGICQADGTCKAKEPVSQASACANVSCSAGNFCSNGQCIPAGAQCKQADPACIYIPHGSFEPPVRAWWWPWLTPMGPDAPTPQDSVRSDLVYPDYVEVLSTPVVMRLHGQDVQPTVVFNSFPVGSPANTVELQGVMRAISGTDGSPIWTAPQDLWNHLDRSVNAISGIASGDCQGTGETCFITGGWDPYDVPCTSTHTTNCNPALLPGQAHQHGGLIAFGRDGRFLWVNRAAQVWWGAPAIARMLGPTGPAQVIVGNGVFDAGTGKTLCPQTNAGGSIGGNGDGTLSALADIDLDGMPELITGNQAFKLLADSRSATGYTCKALFGDGVKMPNDQPCPGGVGSLCSEGFPAVANFAAYGSVLGISTNDKHPQIAVVSRGYLHIHDWTGGMVLSPIPLPTGASSCPDLTYNPGGAPTIADFDGDGLPEIGVASQSAYSVWKPGKGWIWTTATIDCSASTGSSVFDFEGKGNPTVVYSDECFFHVLDGKSGQTLVNELNDSATAYEMPIVADIDGTGRAKILVPNNNIGDGADCSGVWPSSAINRYFGLKALKSPNEKWVNTRSVWNEHTYHVTNVNLDGTLPFPEPQSWNAPQSNSYRQNVQGQGEFQAPDLSICDVKVDMTQCAASGATVTATVYNGGALRALPGLTVDFYAVFDNGSTAHLGQVLTKATLKPGDSETVSIQWLAPPQNQAVAVKAVVDEKGVIGDCHPENNTGVTAAKVKCSPFG